MKMPLVVGALLSAVLALSSFAHAEEAKVENPVTEVGTVKIEWQDPDSYRDLKNNEIKHRFEQRFFDTITKNVNKETEKFFTPQQKLVMQVTDVDLAGDMRPTFGRTTDDIRVVKDLYPPRMTFTYQVLENDKVIIAGDEKLMDMNFMHKLSRVNERPFDAETNMLKDWLKKTIQPQLQATE